MKTVSAAQANRDFSKLLAGVQRGEVFTVVSRGTPVATMGPATSGQAHRRFAQLALLSRLRAQEPRRVDKGRKPTKRWRRDGLYSD